LNGKSTSLLPVATLMKKDIIIKITAITGGNKMNFNNIQALSFEIKKSA